MLTKIVDGVVVPLTQEDIAEIESSNSNDVLAMMVRSQRDALLAETDWTVLKAIETGVPSVYADYRQQLRDITKQAGFPTNVGWPTKPQ